MTKAPSLSELFNNITSDFKTKFSINSENDLKRTLIALSASNAGMLKLFYLALMDVKKNCYPDTADSESMGGTLERYGRLKLKRDPYPAVNGKYTLTVTGTIGATIPIGTQFKNSTGYIYTASQSITLTATSGAIEVMADMPGVAALLSVGDTLFTINTISNISSKAIVSTVITMPTDAENIEDYRVITLQSYRLEPNGGSTSDYVYWALDVAGVRTVYPYTIFGASGAAHIYVEATTIASTDGKGSASQALIDQLWKSDKTGAFEQSPDTTQNDYERGRRQLGFSNLVLQSVTPLPVVITINNLKNASDVVKASITDQVTKMLYLKRPFIAGYGDVNNRMDTLYFKDIVSTLENSLDSGNTYDDVIVTVNSLPLPFQFNEGNIPFLESITYA